MPDFGAPVAQNVNANPGQAFQTLSNLLGIERQGQQLQLGSQALAVGQSQVQQQQQQMRERELLQTAMEAGKDPDGNSLRQPDGEINPVAMNAFASKYLPLTGQSVTQSIIGTLNDRVQLNNAVRGLGQNYRNDISGVIRSAIGTQDGPQQITAALDAYAKQNPQAAPAISRAQSLVQNLNPNMPQAARDMALQHLAMEFQPAATTAGEQAPAIGTTTGPGGGVQAYQTNPLSPVPQGPTGPETMQGLPPGAVTFHDQAGNTYAFNPQTGKTILVGHGGSLQPAAGTPANAQPNAVGTGGTAGKYGTPATILDGLMRVESGGDPFAVNPKSGAMGPYQFLPGTVAALAKQGYHFDPFNPQQARAAADYYLSQLAQKNGGNYAQALQQYGGFVTKNPDAYIANVEAGGAPGAPAAGTGAGAQAGGNENVPPVLSLGEADVIRQNTQTVNQTRVAAANSQTELNVLDHIVSLASTPNLYLGPGSPEIGKLATMVAAIPGMEGAQKYADNYNELAKYMAQNAVRMGKQLGLSGSDARVDLAVHANPNAAIGPQAIIGIAEYQSALVKMGLAKANAMDRWLSQPGNSLANEQNFERIWRENADPRLFQLAGMPNQADATQYSKTHITKGEQKELAKKWQALHDLGAL